MVVKFMMVEGNIVMAGQITRKNKGKETKEEEENLAGSKQTIKFQININLHFLRMSFLDTIKFSNLTEALELASKKNNAASRHKI